MQRSIIYSSRNRRRCRNQHQRGIALLTALVLLLLLTGLSMAMVISVRSDLLINGYYRDFRGSFYAADSGLNIARQEIVNQIGADLATLGPSYNPATTPPLSNAEDVAIQNYLINTYGQSYISLNQGNASGSWPAKYKVTSASFTFVQCTPIGTTGTCAAPTTPPCGYDYIYKYSLTGSGQSRGSQSASLVDNGNVFVKVSNKNGSCPVTFAAWGMFIDSYNICDGTYLVPGTISGPVFTNGSWNFGSTGQYIFTDSVGSAGAQAGYQFNGSCDQVAGTSDQKGGTTIAPTFQNGFSLNQPKIPLPQNSYNQERAVLDSLGTDNNQPSKSDLNNKLMDATKNAYPKNGSGSGVYLPYSVDSKTGIATFSGGGIYVEGNAEVTLSPGLTSTSQVYTIVQGGTTTTITIDTGANTTVFSSGGNTVNIVGTPQLIDPNSAVSSPATMLYVNGNITSLSGPGQGLPAIQDGTQLTVTAAGDVTVTGDILYKTEPVTTTQNQIPNTPADTLIPGNDTKQALGIFTATGDIQLKNGQQNGNLEIDASIASICDPSGDCGKANGGNGGIVNVGDPINTLTIVGGRIQNKIKNINTTTRNIFFDRRFSQNFAPPWFPTTTLPNTGGTTFQTSISRTDWANQTSYY